VEFTETLSKVAVAKLVFTSLLSARPMYTFCDMLIVWLPPTCTQFTPSGDA